VKIAVKQQNHWIIFPSHQQLSHIEVQVQKCTNMSIKIRTSEQGQHTRVLRMSLSARVFYSVTRPFPFLELVLMLDMITAQSKLSNLPINHFNSKTRPKLSLRCRHRHYPHCGSATGLVSVFKIDKPVHIDRVLCLFVP
jgi:hypothetical protein